MFLLEIGRGTCNVATFFILGDVLLISWNLFLLEIGRGTFILLLLLLEIGRGTWILTTFVHRERTCYLWWHIVVMSYHTQIITFRENFRTAKYEINLIFSTRERNDCSWFTIFLLHEIICDLLSVFTIKTTNSTSDRVNRFKTTTSIHVSFPGGTRGGTSMWKELRRSSENLNLNTSSRSLWAWLKLYLTPKRYHYKAGRQIRALAASTVWRSFYNFLRATLNDTLMAWNIVVPS